MCSNNSLIHTAAIDTLYIDIVTVLQDAAVFSHVGSTGAKRKESLRLREGANPTAVVLSLAGINMFVTLIGMLGNSS